MGCDEKTLVVDAVKGFREIDVNKCRMNKNI